MSGLFWKGGLSWKGWSCALGAVLGSMVLVPLLAVAAVVGPATPTARASQPTSAAGSGIPAGYLADFQASGARFGVPWGVLAGIYRLECDFGRSPLAGCNPRGTQNGAGAQGPGQFLAPTWRRSLAPGASIPPGPPTTDDRSGYATDGDGDGIADAWDPADAVASTARLLAANGAATGDLSAAVWAYNHDPTYVAEVMALARSYQTTVSVTSSPETSSPETSSPETSNAVPAPSPSVASALAVARAQLGKPYLWGGAGPDAYDCSGLMMVAFAAAGVELPHNAAAQYALTADRTVPLGALAPGDLVFFGASAATISHVGISIGGGEMIDAPHTGAAVRIEPIGWPDLLVASRPLG